jgi:hypothetical protein
MTANNGGQLMSNTHPRFLRLVSQAVKTLPSQGRNRGSNPLRVTITGIVELLE